MVRFKTVFYIIFLFIILIQLGIYMSDWDFIHNQFLFWFNGIIIFTFILMLGNLIKKKWSKILAAIGIILIVGLVYIGQLFFSFFECNRRVMTVWKIEKYEISYGQAQCWAGSAEEFTYTLNQISYNGLFRKRLDKIWASKSENLITNKTLKQGKACIVKFQGGKYLFDLCTEKNMK